MKTNSELWLEDTSLRRKSIGFEFHGNEFLGHMVAPSEASGPRPLVLVIHNYQGLKGFDVDVAEYLARVGYVGLALSKHRKVSKNANYVQLIKKTKFTRQRTWVSLIPRGRESFKLH